MGPQTRLTALEGSRFSFGRAGVKLPAFLNWLNSVGWDSINNITAAAALAAFAALYGLTTPFWLALAILSIAQMYIAIYGHHFVQIVSKYAGYAFCVVFAILITKVLLAADTLPIQEAGFAIQPFILAFSIAAMSSAGYAPYAADYTRYLPAKTSKFSIMWRISLGMFMSYVVMEVFGVLIAGVIKEQTPEGLMTALQTLSGGLAPLVLLISALGVIPPNAMNDNSAAYCLVSSGIRIPRPLSAATAAIVAFFVSLYGSGHMSTIVQDVMLLLFYWVALWTAIILVHWFISGMHEKKFPKDWTNAATIFCAVTVITVTLFASNELYTGPIAKMLGGADVGFYIGFLMAGSLYWLTLKLSGKKV